MNIIPDSTAERFALEIIGHFYPDDTPFRQMLLKHSYQVCTKAESIIPDLDLRDFADFDHEGPP